VAELFMTLVVSGGLDDTLDVLEQAKTANTMEAATATLPTMVDVDIQMFFLSKQTGCRKVQVVRPKSAF
jgi:hypothetical protein